MNSTLLTHTHTKKSENSLLKTENINIKEQLHETDVNKHINIYKPYEGVRIKTRLSHIFMKNELRVYFFRKPDYASFGYVTIPRHSLVTSNLRHLDMVSAKTGLRRL